MTLEPKRLLGFAFANADFLAEIDAAGTILFSAGALTEFRGAAAGAKAATLFEAGDGARFLSQSRALQAGERQALRLKLAGGGQADVSLFRLPENGERVSCTFRIVDRKPARANLKDSQTGLPSRETFIADTLEKAAEGDALLLVKVPALAQFCREQPAGKVDAVLAAIGQSLTASGAKAAGRLSENSFGALTDPANGPKSQIPAVRAAMAASGLPPSVVQETQVAINGGPLQPGQQLLALRYVVERFTSADKRGDIGRDLGQAFNAMMDETQKRVQELSQTVAAGDFALAYQPICDLKTGALSHFEALARFKPGETAETIQFVEKLGIADAFDLAVALKVISALESDKTHAAHVAFNVSGHTIQSPASFAMLAAFLARNRKLAPRLLVEITETAEITDMDGAGKAMQALRAMGYRVGLDDFGSGAATLNYLHAFHVDFVKFDGSLVRKLGASARDDMLLTAMLKLCRELGFSTIAECLETEADIAKAREAGFDHGQGYALGQPGPIPAGAGMDKRAIKRKGVSESWE